MDMQDKLIIKYNTRKDTKIIDLNLVKDGEVIFDFNEYEPIEITLDSINYHVIIECLSYYLDNDFYVCEENILKIENNLNYKISGKDKYEEIGYIPSKYHITINNEKRKIKCYFKVNYNKEVTEDGMSIIIEKLNEFICGLSIDFFSSAPVNNIMSNNSMATYYVYELLSKYEKKILYVCDQILKSFRMKIENKYLLERYEKKQNFKTVKENIVNYNADKFHNVKKQISYDTSENSILKKYLIKINKIINDCELNISDILKIKEKKIVELDCLIKNEINSKIMKSPLASTNSKNFIKSKTNELEFEQNWMKKLLLWDKSFINVKQAINKLLYCDELCNVNVNNQVNYSNAFYLDNNYRFFYELHNMLSLDITNSRRFNESYLFTDRKSYALFEMYGFIIIQNILKELGLSIDEPKEKNIIGYDSNKMSVFKNENFIVQVQYDYFCRKTNKAQDGEVVSLNSKHCKPDYIINFYDNNGDFLNMLIIEMKYRRLEYMICPGEGTTETDDTLTDYVQLRYLKSKKDNIKYAPYQVILIYPSKEETAMNRHEGRFLGINVLKNFDESIAYLEIKETISKILSK